MNTPPSSCMTAPVEKIESEIGRLVEKAEEIEEAYSEFFENVSSRTSTGRYLWNTPPEEAENLQREALRKYERWYTSASTLVSEYLPQREKEFEQHHEGFKERLNLEKRAKKDVREVLQAQNREFDSLRSILRSVPERVRLRELEVRRQISRNVAQTEIDKARDLFDDGEIRASGVVAGVALERYLLMRCENADEEIEYDYMDGIDALAQKLFENDIIDKSPYQHLKHLSSVRADCAHANEEDPEEDDVERLLDDAEDYIRGRRI